MSPKSSMVRDAYDALKRDILRCRLRPGAVISDTALALDYGMSKTPIRQAVQLLEHEGLVTVIPRRGTFVRAMDFTAIQDVYRMRAILEPEAAVLASQRATAADLQELEMLSAKSETPASDRADRHEANRILHTRIAELTGVPTLARAVESLNEEIERLLNLRSELGQDYKPVNHERLVDAIKNGDADHIREIAATGIDRSRRHVLGVMLGEHDRVAAG